MLLWLLQLCRLPKRSLKFAFKVVLMPKMCFLPECNFSSFVQLPNISGNIPRGYQSNYSFLFIYLLGSFAKQWFSIFVFLFSVFFSTCWLTVSLCLSLVVSEVIGLESWITAASSTSASLLCHYFALIGWILCLLLETVSLFCSPFLLLFSFFPILTKLQQQHSSNNFFTIATLFSATIFVERFAPLCPLVLAFSEALSIKHKVTFHLLLIISASSTFS